MSLVRRLSVLLALLPGWAAAQIICGAATCGVSSGGLSFGSGYDPFGATALDASSPVTVSCTQIALLSICSVPYEVRIDSGGGGSGFAPRQMDSGSDQLDYNIYLDPARLLVWGDGTAGTSTVSGTIIFPLLFGGTIEAQHEAYGRIPASQAVEAGSYSDTMVLTVEF